MATRQKTIQHAFTTLASSVNNTLTNFTQTTLYIPESSIVFRSVIARLTWDDIITATGPGAISTHNMALRLGAASYTTISNATTIASGAGSTNISCELTADFTSHFTSNWSGTSSTCDFQFQINQTAGTTTGLVNISCTLEITYDYDDTSTTQIKTVLLPLDAPVTVLTTSATTYDTIPAIGYFCAEASKTFRNIFVCLEGNTYNNASTTDHTITAKVGTATVTTGNYEAALGTDRRFRYIWELSGSWPSTTATQTFQLSDTVGRCNHLQAYLAITYEFKANAAATTLTAALTDGVGTTVSVTDASVLGTAPYLIAIDNEQMLVTSVSSNDLTVTRGYNSTTATTHSNGATVSPCATNSAQLCGDGLTLIGGGEDNSTYQRWSNTFYIEEPGPIKAGKIAFYLSWASSQAISGLNLRVGTGGFVTYTDSGTLFGGDAALMCRNDAAFTLVRGKNTLTFDLYRTDTSAASRMYGASGRWMICYVSSLSSAGHGAHLCTRRHAVYTQGTDSSSARKAVTAAAPAIPESDYLLSSVGIEFMTLGSAGAGQPQQFALQVERLAGEGGIRLDPVWASAEMADGRVGSYHRFASMSKWFKRWPADTGFERMDLETARRYYWTMSQAGMHHLAVWYTYSTCGPFVVSGNVTGSSGGTVDVGLHRASDGELLKSTTVTGNSAFSFDWWDNTENVFAEASESNVRLGRSASGIGAGSP